MSEAGAAALRKHFEDAKLTVSLLAPVLRVGSEVPTQIDHAAIVGGGYAPVGLASEITEAMLAEAVATKLGSQVFLARMLLPLVAPSSSYNVITGGLGERPERVPNLALTSIMSAAVFVRGPPRSLVRAAWGSTHFSSRSCWCAPSRWSAKTGPDRA